MNTTNATCVLRLPGVWLVVLLAGCITPPRLPPHPPLLTSADVGISPQVSLPAADQAWWRAFADPQLDRLMEKALADSPHLAQALARVAGAQALADARRADLAPTISFSAQETRQRYTSHDLIPPPYAGSDRWEGHEGLNLSWDLDFWGRQAALLRQARSQADADALDVATARLALAGALVRTYIDLYRNDALAEVDERAEAQRERILEITGRRVRSGLDTNVELREASGAVPQVRVELLQARAIAEVDKHELASLSAQGAELYAQIQPPTFKPEAILTLPAVLPADLLSHRPDVIAARDRITAASAGQQAAKAAFFPDINLLAFAGTTAIGLDNLLQGSSAAFGVGPALHLPVFDAGRLRAQYRGNAAEVDQAIAVYNSAVLEAVRETSDQIGFIKALNAQIIQQQQVLEDAEEAYRLAEERYRSGLTSFLTVLTTETAVLEARRERIALACSLATAHVNLLLAVGGSFDPQTP